MNEEKSPKTINKCRYILSVKNGGHRKSESTQKFISGAINYLTKKDKSNVINMIDYYNGNINHKERFRLMLPNGEYATNEQEENIKKEMFQNWKNGANIYQGIISFNNDYIDERISLEDLHKKIETEVLPRYLKAIGFQDMNKMIFTCVLHTDSKSGHYHLHYMFQEKEPNFKTKKMREIKYKYKGKIDQEQLDLLKREIVLSIEREAVFKPLVKETNEELDKLKSYFKENEHNFLLHNKKDLILDDKIRSLGKLLEEEGLASSKKIKFGSIKNKKIISLTKEITNYLYNQDEFKVEYDKFLNSCNKINDYFAKINMENNSNQETINSNYVQKKLQSIDSFAYNQIINYAKYKKMYSNDLNNFKYNTTKELAKRSYQKYKEPTRYQTINNYLNYNQLNRFRDASLWEIKKMNREMDEILFEFSKMNREKI